MGENHDKPTQLWIPFNFKVMIIDEDSACLRYTAAVLQACNFEVVTFGNPTEALVQFGVGEKKYDLVLVDLSYTKLPRFYFTDRIIKNFGIPVITMGIDEGSNLKNESYQHGACFHITKPITIMKMDYIWKKLWIKSPMRKKPRSNEEASSLPETENSKKVDNAKMKQKLFHVDSNFDETSKFRLAWDPELNKRFKVAVELLGKDATPTNIIGIMNADGLSTKHIASHLQKYRCKCEKEKKKRRVQPSAVVQLPTYPVHTKSTNTDELNIEFIKCLSEARNNDDIMQVHQKESTNDNYNQEQYEYNLSSARESAPLQSQMNLGYDVQEHEENSTANQFVKNVSGAMERAPLHNQMNVTFGHHEESRIQYSQLVKDLSSAMENAPLHNQMNLAFDHREESYWGSAVQSAPLLNQMNLGFHIPGNTGSCNQQPYVNNLSNAMKSGELHNQMNMSFDYSSFKVPQPAPFMHSNHQLIEPRCNFNINSTVVQPNIPVMNYNANVANHQPLPYMDANDEWNMDELLGSSNAFETFQHQDALIMSSFHDADLNYSSGFNNYRNLNFDNDAFLEEMFGNAQAGGTD